MFTFQKLLSQMLVRNQAVGLLIAVALFNFIPPQKSSMKQSSPTSSSNLQESKRAGITPEASLELQVSLNGYSFEVNHISKPFLHGGKEGKELVGFLYYIDAKNIETGKKQRVWQKHYFTTQFLQAAPASFVIAHRSGSDFTVAYIANATYVKFEEFSANKPAPTPSNIGRPFPAGVTLEETFKAQDVRNNGPNSFDPRKLEPSRKQGFTVFGPVPAITKVRLVNDAWEVTVHPASAWNPDSERRFRYQRNKDGKKWKLVEIEKDTKLPSPAPLDSSR